MSQTRGQQKTHQHEQGHGEQTEHQGRESWFHYLGNEIVSISITRNISIEQFQLTSSSTDLDVQSSNANLPATGRNILSSQHSSVWRGFVTIRLDLHSPGDTNNCFPSTGRRKAQRI